MSMGKTKRRRDEKTNRDQWGVQGRLGGARAGKTKRRIEARGDLGWRELVEHGEDEKTKRREDE